MIDRRCSAHRWLRISLKYRGQAFRGGFHDFMIRTGGLDIFPRLVSKEHRSTSQAAIFHSGNAELHELLDGGALMVGQARSFGPAGCGKSLITFQFVAAAIRRGENVAFFAFDEELGLVFRRTKAMGIDLEAFHKEGSLFIEQVDAAELSPGEFSHRVRPKRRRKHRHY